MNSSRLGEVIEVMEKIYSICGMCTVRCPIEVHVEGGEILRVQGSGPAGLDGSLCPRGGAGLALLNDHERPQYPMIRVGERGEGKWRQASWDEALTYIADKLTEVVSKHGHRSILMSDRGGPFPDLHKAFMRAMGSPNYCNHDASCARNVQHAAQSGYGGGRKGVSYDLGNARHVVLQTRNIFEAINVSEVKNLIKAKNNGCKITVIDVRANLSACKADNFFMVRPGTRLRFQPGGDKRAHKRRPLQKGIREESFQGFRGVGELCGSLHPRVGRRGMRRRRQEAGGFRKADGRGRARGYLASGLEHRPLHDQLLRVPHRLHHQRPFGHLRGQGRASAHGQGQGRRAQGLEGPGGPLSQAR